jgi:hypothetical protein
VKVQVSNPQQLKLFGIIFLAAGMGLLGVAGFFTFRTLRFLGRSVNAEGTITALVQITRSNDDQDGGNARITYAPQFSFTDAKGETVTVTSNISSSPPAFDVGDSVGVLYLPDDPEQARIDSFWQLWGVALITGGIGTMFLGFVLAMALTQRALVRRSAQSLSAR